MDLKYALDGFDEYEETNKSKLVSLLKYKSLPRWAASHCNVNIDNGKSFTDYKLQHTVDKYVLMLLTMIYYVLNTTCPIICPTIT